MQNDIDRLTQRYRSLVLSHAYILARESGIAMGRLPKDTLEGLGIKPKFSPPGNGTTFVVRIPADLESPEVAGMLGRFEREVRKNGHLFPPGFAPRAEEGEGECKKVGFRPRRNNGKKAIEEFDVEPLDEKALMRMASGP
ncbi:hypothetical protein L0Y65_06580 [Candidatus Micrarchaeota archaeon]|nr:hypothetical protein [Candidatus Micrarchaeota archaeon]